MKRSASVTSCGWLSPAMEHALDRSTMNPTRHRQNSWEIIIFFSSYEQENVKQYLKPHSKDGVTTTQLQEQQEKQMPGWLQQWGIYQKRTQNKHQLYK
jgi:hypothetical protein